MDFMEDIFEEKEEAETTEDEKPRKKRTSTIDDIGDFLLS